MKMYCYDDCTLFNGDIEYRKGQYYRVASDFLDGYSVEDENGRCQSFSKHKEHKMSYLNWFHLID